MFVTLFVYHCDVYFQSVLLFIWKVPEDDGHGRDGARGRGAHADYSKIKETDEVSTFSIND
jgi:hypothetical protein